MLRQTRCVASRTSEPAAARVRARAIVNSALASAEPRCLELVVTGFELSGARGGGVLSFLCTPACADVPSDGRELVLLLPPALAGALSSATRALSALPPSLLDVPDLHMKDIRLLFVDDAESGSFYLHDLASGAGERWPAPVSEVLAAAIRHQQPVLVAERAVVELTRRAVDSGCVSEAVALALREQLAACAADEGAAPHIAPLLQQLAGFTERGALLV